MLGAEGLRKRYGDVEALAGLELEIRPGEVDCLLGPNGAGKSTTMNLFLGFTAPTAGRAWVCDLRDVAQHPIESKRHLAYIPEQVHLYPHLSGLENIEYFASLAGTAASRPELDALLVRVGQWVANWAELHIVFKEGGEAIIWANTNYQIENGKIVRSLTLYNEADALRQMGYQDSIRRRIS